MKGRRLGHYELLGTLGRGGMGVVLRARDTRLNRDVALKLLVAETSAKSSRRFEREAQALARLRHPNVVTVHEVGHEGDRAFLVMEFVEGEDLGQRVRREGPLPEREAAELLRSLASAVAHAHSHGILHRDIKPDNVLVDSAGQPRLTDFGLAKAVDSQSRLSKTGGSLGTPGYWPPEQARGKLDQIGPQADVYSLGATLYALLTGEPPFADAPGFAAQVVAVSQQAPCPPRDLAPGLSRALEAICLRCLAKSPASRYPSAEALHEALDEFLAGDVQAPARAWAGAAVTLALVLGILGLVLHGAGDAEREPETTRTPATLDRLPPSLSAALAELRTDVSALRRAEQALDDLEALDAEALRELHGRAGPHGHRLEATWLYLAGRLDEALRVEGEGAWCRGLEAARQSRGALAEAALIMSYSSRADAPRMPRQGAEPQLEALCAAWKTMLQERAVLGRLGEELERELWFNTWATLCVLPGLVSESLGEEQAQARLLEFVARSPRPSAAVQQLKRWKARVSSKPAWEPAAGEPSLALVASTLRGQGPGVVVLKFVVATLEARIQRPPPTLIERVEAARRAMALARGCEIPLADLHDSLSLQLNGLWRRVGRSAVLITWDALRSRRPPPWPVADLAWDVSHSVRERLALLLLARRFKEALACVRDRRISILRTEVEVEVLLATGKAQDALRMLDALQSHERIRLQGMRVHALSLMGRQADARAEFKQLDPRREQTTYPWHLHRHLESVMKGECWWPGEAPR
jgi:predicted Ser/Thr protein kinase